MEVTSHPLHLAKREERVLDVNMGIEDQFSRLLRRAETAECLELRRATALRWNIQSVT